jgi:RNA polymerase sigma-70 factor (ECF subfamily)
MASGPELALEAVVALDAQGELSSYHYLPAIKADLLRRLGRIDEARFEQRRAIELTANESERAYLESQLASPSFGQ